MFHFKSHILREALIQWNGLEEGDLKNEVSLNSAI